MKKIKDFLGKYVHHIWWHLLVVPVFAVAAILWDWLIDGKTLSQVTSDLLTTVYNNPKSASYPIVFLAIASITYRAIRFMQIKWTRLKALELMAKEVGIREFRHHNETERHSNWENCTKELESFAGGQLNILGAGGFETFSGPSSPLYKLLKDTNYDVRILLLNPKSSAFNQRCASVNVSEQIYKDWIYTSIEYCKYLKNHKNASIEVRLYSDYPIWKMIFTPEYMWLQWYHPNDNVHHMPVYLFQSTKAVLKTSLYYPLIKVFDRRWKLGEQIKLENWTRPK